MLTEFKNEPLTDFSVEENRRKMEEAISFVASKLGEEYDPIIGGKRIRMKDKIRSLNPSKFDEVVGLVSRADVRLAEKAIDTALKTFETWKLVPPAERARYLVKAAAVMRRRKLELAAWMVFEIGKNWMEADADVAEAIDFLDFYAREMIRYSQPQPTLPYAGEDNELVYIPLGVGVVIPPWNFPLAILTGMTSASIVAGNTVVLKPASDTPVIAAKFMEVLEEAGLPPGVVNYLPGSGGTIGDYLVTHPKTRFITFTGSKEVGLRINALASKHQKGQIWIKRVIAEMGGKDTIIVDRDTDLDAAVDGIVNSAFGFQGQKCSACSRVVALKEVYDELLRKLVARVKKIKTGPVREYENYLGPVSSKNAFESILNYIEIGKKEGSLLTGGKKVRSDGWFIQPTIIADVKPNARISQEEIFGPVLAIIKARNFDEAMKIVNNTEYGLTGGVYSRKREHLERARKEFHVGNLYLNRKITGALVAVQPFGGFNMSGTDSKAGGRDYLLLFMQAKTITERF
ncbi:MAG: L-glutamate gamma-semialdehyde dehydrogenase [Acidobacteriota bacterium]